MDVHLYEGIYGIFSRLKYILSVCLIEQICGIYCKRCFSLSIKTVKPVSLISEIVAHKKTLLLFCYKKYDLDTVNVPLL